MDKKNVTVCILWSLGFAILILDAKHALLYAREGITACLFTVIPSLFPLFVISGSLNQHLQDYSFPGAKLIGKLTGIPQGAESILVFGLLGGYPLGARMVQEAYESNRLDLESARRMMGFCSNPGPAFIFGIAGILFPFPVIPWLLWGTICISAIFTGILLPKGNLKKIVNQLTPAKASLSQILLSALKTMGIISGWVVLFKVLIGFMDRWILWILPDGLQVLVCGMMELTNGCLALNRVHSPTIQYILATVMLTSGGLCVGMQTKAVAKSIGLGLYIPGKFIETLCSLLLASMTAPFIFRETVYLKICTGIAIFSLLGITVTAIVLKKAVAFQKNLLYNSPSLE